MANKELNELTLITNSELDSSEYIYIVDPNEALDADKSKRMLISEIDKRFTNKSTGDIEETSFSALNNQTVAANVTGLAFSNGSIRAFKAILSISIDADTDLFEVVELIGIQRTSDWQMTATGVGDATGVVFTIDTSGQVQYTSTDQTGFVSNNIKFKAKVLTI